MKFKATNYDIKQSLKGDIEITFFVAPENSYAVKTIIKDEALQGNISVEVKKYRKPRTLDQNALLWAIETKIAHVLKTTPKEVHKSNLLDYGVKIGEAIMRQELAEKWCKNNYCTIINAYKKKGVNLAKIAIYKGSSEYTTEEFSRLVDGVLEECKQLGINVAYESKELQSLLKG